MKTCTKEELKVILADHKKWINDEGGTRANLSSTDLRSANLSSADLRYADLSSANLSSADLLYADLRYANLSSADLSSANLSSADLLYANLSSADLRYANLSSANLRDCVGERCHVRSLQIETYSITYTSAVMQIGCKRHTFEEWQEFTDQQIIEMDGKTALSFWRKWKKTIFTLVEMAPATPSGFKEKGEVQ